MSTVIARGGSDIRVMGLVGVAHWTSHFFHLVLPPLFPLLKVQFGVSYTELGLLMTVFFAVSGLSQTPAGFVVDRYGAAPVLAGGLGLLGLGAVLAAFAPSYVALLPAMVILGLGNTVFHPADYAIMSHHVSQPRMARAFSVHTIGGTLGWAVAPVLMVAVAEATSWRIALLMAGIIGLVMAALVFVHRRELDTPAHDHPSRAGGEPGFDAYLKVLASAPILLCFAYFCLQSLALIGLQGFMPLSLEKLWGIDLILATTSVTALMLGSALGTLAGGVVADRTGKLQLIIAGGLGFSALLVLAVGLVPMPVMLLWIVIGLAGAGMGFTTPSRDLLVRSVAPKGSSGKVFGFVYSGLDLGATVAPAIVGAMLDHAMPKGLFILVAIVTFGSIFTAGSVTPTARVPGTAR